jgi:hypothetical protein
MKQAQTQEQLPVVQNRQEVAIPETGHSLLATIERAAKDPTVDIDKMERLLGMAERMEARNAEQQFNEAMRAVQESIPRILRDATNPSTNSKYARLESLLKVVVPIYTAAGFSISFGTADCPHADHYRITATVSHKAGHSRPYQCDIPSDTTGMKGTMNKTKTHGFGSTMSYGRRYLTLLIFNIALVNEDDDAATRKQSSSGRVATVATRDWFLEQTKDIRVKLQTYAIDKAIIMPNEPLEAWPLSKVPTSKTELAALRQEIEAHQ